jgi:hypothetical protein
MSIRLVPINSNENKQSETTTNPIMTKYVPLTDVLLKKTVDEKKECQQQPQEPDINNSIIRSKVLVIENLSVTITQDFDEDVEFVIKTDPGILSDHKTIPELDITAREDIEFDEDITKAKLESIIRRCGVLDKYAKYFVTDPEIIINCYTLTIKKTYKYFNEFKEGILIGGDIFM